MKFTIISSEELKANKWSGGTTTELFIDPPTADYQQRNFNFRLSTAKVEIENSVFTSLPDVSRKIMILDGQITINHKNHYAKILRKFDTDSFEGDWETSAKGICTDFNLMTTGLTKGELNAFVIKKNKSYNLQPQDTGIWLIIYVYSGNVSVVLKNKIHQLNTHNVLIINNLTTKSIQFNAIETSEIISCEIESVK